MKRISKYLWSLAGMFAAVVLCLPVCVQAGGAGAAVEAIYVILEQDGGYHYYKASSEEEYLGISAELTCPDGRKLHNTITWPFSITDNYGTHLFLLANEDNVSSMPAGVYRLTNFECPRGYEYDNAMEDRYPLAVTITQNDINEYVEWVHGGVAGTRAYPIYVPVKLKGTVSAVLQKPEKPILSPGRENLEINPDNCEANYSVEYQYASKKNGTYKTCGTAAGSYRFETAGSRIKHGKTYYFRARYCKVVNGKKTCGDFCAPLKIKVSKSDVFGSRPVLKVQYRSGKPYLKVTDASGRFYWYKVFYSEKKNGKYKEFKKTFSGKENVSASKITKLKSGRKYYILVRYIDQVGAEKFYGSYSNKQKVKMP